MTTCLSVVISLVFLLLYSAGVVPHLVSHVLIPAGTIPSALFLLCVWAKRRFDLSPRITASRRTRHSYPLLVYLSFLPAREDSGLHNLFLYITVAPCSCVERAAGKGLRSSLVDVLRLRVLVVGWRVHFGRMGCIRQDGWS